MISSNYEEVIELSIVYDDFSNSEKFNKMNKSSKKKMVRVLVICS